MYEVPIKLDTNGNRTFQVHHKGDNHITKTIWKIEYGIYELLQKKSDMKLCKINSISIEMYTYHRAAGGSYFQSSCK
jgi:hypothetical protein